MYVYLPSGSEPAQVTWLSLELQKVSRGCIGEDFQRTISKSRATARNSTEIVIVQNEQFGFKRVDHASLTVRDMGSAVRFYTEVLGAKVLYEMGPFDARDIPKQSDGRDWTDAHVNVPDAKLRIVMLSFGGDAKLELFEYARPTSGRDAPPRNSDIGAAHLCLEVGDIRKAVDYLSAHGCQAMTGPITMEEGPCPASHSWYVKDPFGNQLELVEYLRAA